MRYYIQNGETLKSIIRDIIELLQVNKEITENSYIVLIWEDFYGCKIPNGYVIHHKNKNKLDNCVLNLQLMRKTDHDKLHKSEGNHPNCGSNFPIEHRLNISKSRNTTGYFRVCKEENKGVKQGFVWRYKYYKNGKSKSFVSVSLKTLEERVKAKGLEWRKL